MDLITRRVPVKNIGLPKWVNKVLKDHKIDDHAVMIRKGISPEDTKFKEGERSSVDYITTKAIDRDGEIVVPKGAILDHYRSHPVVLFGHDYKSLPIGKSLWIKIDEKGLIAKTQYAKHQKAEEIYQYRKDGFPMAKSIGFIPLKSVEEADFDKLDLKELGLEEADLKGASRVYPSWLMLEYSDVPVPSNPEALQLAISKNIITLAEAKEASKHAFVIELLEPEEKAIIEVISPSGEEVRVWTSDEPKAGEVDDGEKIVEEVVMKPETTENYHHIPIRSASEFVDGSLRTITLSAQQGIKAVIGKLKSDPNGSTKVQKYMFDADKFTMAMAQAWVDNHKDMEPDETKIEESVLDEKEFEKRYGTKVQSENIHEAEVEDEVTQVETSFGVEMERGFVYHGTPKFKSVDSADGIWNKSLKELDVANIDVPPSTIEYAMLKEWLGCEVREMYVHSYSIPSALMGTYLTGFNESLKGFDLITARNFTSGGYESPLEYDIIQLTSEKSADFLISGTEFYENKETKTRVAVKRRMTWYGFYLESYSKASTKDVVIKVFKDMEEWAADNNFLKGECFSLSGEFIKKTNDTWSDLFISQKNDDAIKRTVKLINEKGSDLANRGIIMMGNPGTGKTLSGRIIRNTTDTTFIWVSARDFIYAGATDGLSYGFKLARSLAPTILFIEDIDNWLGARTCDLMKTEMDGISQSKGVITILTSNYPELLPPALIDRPGRFHDVLNFDLPDVSIRRKMLAYWAPEVHEKIVDDVISETKGFSGAHMYELVAFAKTILDEGEYTMDEAIMLSIAKIKEQRELIGTLTNTAQKSIDNKITIKLFDDEVEEKAGRVLSKKTRSIMTDAIDAMGKAVSAINELIETSDKKEDEIEIVESEEKLITLVETPIPVSKMIEVDVEALRKAITETFKGVLSNQKVLSASDIVEHSLNKAKGKVY